MSYRKKEKFPPGLILIAQKIVVSVCVCIMYTSETMIWACSLTFTKRLKFKKKRHNFFKLLNTSTILSPKSIATFLPGNCSWTQMLTSRYSDGTKICTKIHIIRTSLDPLAVCYRSVAIRTTIQCIHWAFHTMVPCVRIDAKIASPSYWSERCKK